MRGSSLALVAVLVAGIVAVAPASGVPEQTPKRGRTLVFLRPAVAAPACLNPFCGDVADPALTQVLEGAFEFGPDLMPRSALIQNSEDWWPAPSR